MSGWSELFWRRLPGVQRRERHRFLYFVSISAALSLAQTVGLTGSEALFLARYGVQWLPHVFVAGSTFTVLGSLAYAGWVGRRRNDVLFIEMLVGVAAGVLLATFLATREMAGAYPVLLCVWFLAQSVFTNHYWTFTGDYFDTLAAKRLFPLFLIGQSLGGTLGGGIAALLARSAPPEGLLLAWSAGLAGTAILLAAAHRPLRRWGPLELAEADETSADALRGAVRYTHGSRLAQWLVVSTAGMVLALFLAQYVYSQILVEAFPTPAGLAIFLGVYLAVTNLLEVGVEARLTAWLLRRLGVPTTNLVHPGLTVLSFGAVVVHAGLGSAVLLRANREMLENSLAQPVRTLVYNALPYRFRGRIRAFLEGIVAHAGMAGAGLVLLALGGSIDPRWLIGAGVAAGLLYLGANLAVREPYVATLVGRLREGRLDLDDPDLQLGPAELTPLAEIWETSLADREEPSAVELRFAGFLVERGLSAPVIRGAAHARPAVRRACVEALARGEDGAGDAALTRALRDEDAGVRLAALAASAHRPSLPEGFRSQARTLLEDPDPRVRAEAARSDGPAGEAALRRMARSADPEEASAALARLPASLLPEALTRTRDPEPAVRAAALLRASELAERTRLDPSELDEALADRDPRVRKAAVRGLASQASSEAATSLARALTDPVREVRRSAHAALGSLGEAAVDALVPLLSATQAAGAEAAVETLGMLGPGRARRVLGRELRRRVHEAWESVLVKEAVGSDTTLAHRLLRVACHDREMRSRRLALRILQQLEDPRTMRAVDRVLRVAATPDRAVALEVLSHLADAETGRLLVLLLEEGPVQEKLWQLPPALRPPATEAEAFARARASGDAWLGLAAQFHADGDAVQEGNMERLLFLRQVALFGRLSLEQLVAVDRILNEVPYVAGEIIMREGESGRELYVLLEGEVDVYKAWGTEREERVATHRPGDYFGEMAILADEPRSATLVARGDARLLALDGERLKELILEMPEVSFEIFRVLTARILRAESRVRELEERRSTASS